MNIEITRTTTPRQKPEMKGIRFGTYFSDHMFLMNYTEGKGWYNPRIVPYGTIELEPSAMVFHYAQEIFEGMKAYRTEKGNIQLFRPMDNIERFNNSGVKLCIPHIPEEDFRQALKTLVEVDKDWVPSEPDTSLYIRPFAIALDAQLGVHVAKNYLFCIITCPVGAYYPEGLNPVKIAVEAREVRAVRGGTGFTKCGGNYAASLHASHEAGKKGFSQVLWLDGVEQKYIEEVGAMNVMFKINGKIVTPSLEKGTVLPGVTRRTALAILRHWGYEVEERDISIDELVLEVTESAYSQNMDRMLATVTELRRAGFKIEMDDFGSGYSSLNMLCLMPIDALKIDMKFVRNVASSSTGYRMVELVIEMARALGVPAIVEGVEDEAQYRLMKQVGCDIVQGYYFSRPVDAAHFEPMLADL
jgi:branched-chain amino acid aminotransferase